jgi:eukaryotic-like serine/threonine-protein kinase
MSILDRPDQNSYFSFATVTLDRHGQITNNPVITVEYQSYHLGNGIEIDMAYVPSGQFSMGSEEHKSEQPIHLVNVPEFYISKYPITQAQYLAVMGNNPARFQGATLPVEQVSWLDAREFCQKLSDTIEQKFRLPSEAEWEYACRAHTNTPFSFGATITADVVNHNGEHTYASAAPGIYRQKTTAVGSFPANLFGLYDMHGNVWEWCLDEWSDDYRNAPTDGSASGNIDSPDPQIARVIRGGSWCRNPWMCRSARRKEWLGGYRYSNGGFRIVK